MSVHETSEAKTARGFYNCPETPEPVSLQVVGKLPEWLAGVLYRTGPGTYSIPTQSSHKSFQIRHWFDGLTLHHRFEIKDGGVTYRSRNGASQKEEYIKRNGRFPPGGSFGQADPCETILGRFFAKFKQWVGEPKPNGPSSENIGVTFTPHFTGFSVEGNSELVVKTDFHALQRLDRVTLEPIEIRTYSTILPELDGPMSAAHAGIGGNGDFFNYTMSFGSTPTYKVFKINSMGKATILAEITDAPPAYIHTVFLTDLYVVLAVWQSDFKLNGLPVVLYDAMSVNTFKEWSDGRKTLFFVIDREEGGVVGRYQSDAFFAFHGLNSYDDQDGSVVLDISCYPNNKILDLLTLESLRSLSASNTAFDCGIAGSARRFRLENINAASTTPGIFMDVTVEFDLGLGSNIELPVVAPSVANKPYRYAYGIHWESDDDPVAKSAFVNSIIKIDTKTGKKMIWKDKNPMVPGEPIFVGRPRTGNEEPGEDAGVLLTVALDANKGTSALIVIDALNMIEIARAEMRVPVPFGFHGAFTKD